MLSFLSFFSATLLMNDGGAALASTPQQPPPPPTLTYPVTAFGAQPNDGLDDGPAIRAAIQAAKAGGGGIVEFAAGTYHVGSAPPQPNQPPVGLDFAAAQRITLQPTIGAAVTIAFTDLFHHGIQIQDSTDLTFRDLVLTYGSPCHFEGILQTANNAGGVSTYVLHCPNGVDANDAFLFGAGPWRLSIFDPVTRSRRPLSAKLTGNSASVDAAGTTVTMTLADDWLYAEPIVNAPQYGDLIAVGVEYPSHMVWSMESKNLLFERVRIEQAPFFAAQHTFDSNVTYSECTIGAAAGTVQPLLSTNRDGLRFRSMRGAVQVVDCRIERCGDDAINIHTQWIAVNRPLYPGYVTLVDAENAGWPLDLRVGDALVAHDPTTLASPGNATIVGIHPSASNSVQIAGYPLAFGDWAVNANAQATDILIQNNLIRDVDARAILVRGIRGTISGNRIVDTPKGGIVVCPDVQYFKEAGFSRALAILGNTIHVSGYGRWYHDSATSCQLGALTVGVEHAQSSWPAGLGHAEILVKDNWIAASSMVGLFVASADTADLVPSMSAPLFGAVVQDNWVLASQLAPNPSAGSTRGITNASGGLHLLQVDHTDVMDNHIDNRGNGAVLTIANAGMNTLRSGTVATWSTSFEQEEDWTWAGQRMQPFVGRKLATSPTDAIVGGWHLQFDSWHLQGRDLAADFARGHQCSVCSAAGGTMTIDVDPVVQPSTSKLTFWATKVLQPSGSPRPLVVDVITAAGTTRTSFPSIALAAAPSWSFHEVTLPAGTMAVAFRRVASNAEVYVDDVVVSH